MYVCIFASAVASELFVPELGALQAKQAGGRGGVHSASC